MSDSLTPGSGQSYEPAPHSTFSSTETIQPCTSLSLLLSQTWTHANGPEYRNVPGQPTNFHFASQDSSPLQRVAKPYAGHEETWGRSNTCTDDRPRSEEARPHAWDWLLSEWMYGWVAECAGCLLAVISLVAMIGVLFAYEDRPIPEWPMGISINALIAIFGIFLKAGISAPLSEGISQLKWQWFAQKPRRLIDLEEFDSASRGPWGSLLFLFRSDQHSAASFWVRLRRISGLLTNWEKVELLNSLAKASAFLTVLSFVIDPFSQQIVQYSPCQRESLTDIGILARTNLYMAHHLSSISDAMAVAINMGLVSPPTDKGASSLVRANCATGNCTLPKFSTVAICHSCQDIGDTVHTSSAPVDWRDYFIPADDDHPAVSFTHNETELGREILKTGVKSRSEDGGSFRMSSELVSMKILAGVPTNASTPVSPVAIACQITPCVRTYRASVHDSILNETELHRIVMPLQTSVYPEPSHWVAATTESQIIVPVTREGTADCTPADDLSQSQLEISPSALYAGECLWSLYQESYWALRDELEWQLDNLTMYWTPNGTDGSIIPRRLWNDGKLDLEYMNRFMANVSDVMTATIRNTGGIFSDSSGEYATGPAFETVTCVNVQWAWLSYSVALVVMATVWLGALIWHSPRGEETRKAWKSSSLAVLLAGISEEKASAATAAMRSISDCEGKRNIGLFDLSRYQMERVAGSIETQLQRDEKGRARFV